jgi:hypothetical protein
MTKYEVTATARIHAGVLALTTEQAAARAHNLKALGNGRFEVVHPVEFKAGEVIAYEGDLPKVLATALVDAAAKASDGKKAKAKAEAEAKAKEDGEA